VTTFLGICLLAFAAWIALGLVFMIGRARPSITALMTVAIAAFAIFVLTVSAIDLPHS
jgi:hypothetical protein